MACMARTWIRAMSTERREAMENPRSPKRQPQNSVRIVKQKAGGYFPKTINRRRKAARMARASRRINRQRA